MKKQFSLVLATAILALLLNGCVSRQRVFARADATHISGSGSIIDALGIGLDTLFIETNIPDVEIYIYADGDPIYILEGRNKQGQDVYREAVVTAERPRRVQFKTYSQYGQNYHVRADVCRRTPDGKLELLGRTSTSFYVRADGYPDNRPWTIDYYTPVRR